MRSVRWHTIFPIAWLLALPMGMIGALILDHPSGERFMDLTYTALTMASVLALMPKRAA